jgi:uncharacterized protein YndB with AHSA1/START domain
MPHQSSPEIDDATPHRRTAMGTFRLAIDLTRPPGEVFAFIAEPRNMPRWYDAVDHVAQTTAGPHSIGARYDVTRSLPGGQVHNDVEITEHTPNRLVTLESRAGPTPFRYRYELQPNGPGTHLTLDGRISSAGLSGPIARVDSLATQLFKRGMKQNLGELKRIIEAAERPTDRSDHV